MLPNSVVTASKNLLRSCGVEDVNNAAHPNG